MDIGGFFSDVYTGFTSDLQTTIQPAIDSYNRYNDNAARTGINAGGDIFEAMHGLVAGGVDQFEQNLVAKFRKSDTGQKLEQTATRQKISEILHTPKYWLIGGGALALLIGIGYKLGKFK